jgi:hypothetical protein
LFGGCLPAANEGAGRTAHGDIGRMVLVREGEREGEKIKKRKEHGTLSPECAGQRALPAKLSVVEGRFVCLCLHAPAGLTARGRHVRNAPGASQS